MVVRFGLLSLGLSALAFTLVAFAWGPYAANASNPSREQSPLSAFQPGVAVGFPAGEKDGRPGWHAPSARRDGGTFVESLPVGTFRPLETAPSPPQWSYGGYLFRPLEQESQSFRTQTGASATANGLPGESGYGLGLPLPAGRWEYGHSQPRFSFQLEQQWLRKPSYGVAPMDLTTWPPREVDYPSGIQDFTVTGYHAPFEGPQEARW